MSANHRLLESLIDERRREHQPDDETSCSALLVLRSLASWNLPADRILLGNEGEISFYVFGKEVTEGGAHVRYGRLVCSEEGLVAQTFNRRTKAAKTWEVQNERTDVDTAISTIQQFLTAT